MEIANDNIFSGKKIMASTVDDVRSQGVFPLLSSSSPDQENYISSSEIEGSSSTINEDLSPQQVSPLLSSSSPDLENDISSSEIKSSSSTINDLSPQQEPVQSDLVSSNLSSEMEDSSSATDEEFSTQNEPFQQYIPVVSDDDDSSSEKEDSVSIMDEELSSQQEPVQYDSEDGNSSSEKEDSVSTMDEELSSLREPVQDDSEDGNSSDWEDSTSGTEDDDIRKKASLKRERKLGLRRCYPIVWAGALTLLRLQSEIEMKFVWGDSTISKEVLTLPEDGEPTIDIGMKLAFEDVPQDHTELKMKAKKGSCLLLALPINNNKLQTGHMEHRFIRYFRRKGAIGVAEFPQNATENPQYKMFIFPPSDYVYNCLYKIAPTLANTLYLETDVPHLLCLITKICYCIYCEKTKKIHTRV